MPGGGGDLEKLRVGRSRIGFQGLCPSLRLPVLHLMIVFGRDGMVIIKQGKHVDTLLNNRQDLQM